MLQLCLLCLLGIVTGWGATEAHGHVANKLQEVSVPILSNVDCRKTGYGNKITDNMMCAGFPKGGKDSCQVYPCYLLLSMNELLFCF